ncbi:hypothetical protein ILYODFUR_039218 [Ilyodon furcidens]|uniref:Uncharacterized protein n=1 Tax=Ilyodon furcidens TaxID=33524 RepID=A0ABV0TG34_9TELE
MFDSSLLGSKRSMPWARDSSWRVHDPLSGIGAGPSESSSVGSLLLHPSCVRASRFTLGAGTGGCSWYNGGHRVLVTTVVTPEAKADRMPPTVPGIFWLLWQQDDCTTALSQQGLH